MTRPSELLIRMRNEDETVQQLVEVLDVLDIGIAAYRSGRYAAWRICSVYIHQLLTDRTRNNIPVALRVLPTLQIHPLRGDDAPPGVSYLMRIPVSIHPDEQGIRLTIFDVTKTRVPLDEVLDKSAFIATRNETGRSVQLRDIITNLRNQAGGAHYDPRLTEMMAIIEEGLLTIVTEGQGRPMYVDYIVALAEYVHVELTTQLMAAIGSGRLQRQEYEEAREFFDAALKHAQKAGSLQGIYEVLHLRGLTYFEQKNFEAAIQDWTEGLPLSRQLNDMAQTTRFLKNLAAAFVMQGNVLLQTRRRKAAAQRYQQGLAYAVEANSADQVAVIRSNLALTQRPRFLGRWLRKRRHNE